MDRNITFRRSAQKSVREGDIEKAIEAYEEVVSSGDADPYDFVYAGDLYVKLDLVEEAVGRFSRGVSAYSRLGFNRNAIALCRRILRLDPQRRDIQRELGDLFATEELLDDALESYFHYLESVPPEEREDEIFRETLVRVEELAPRRPSYAMRLSEFLESLGHTEASADVLSHAADLARSAGDDQTASELMQRAIGLNPLVARAASVADSIEERLQQVHRSKVQSDTLAAESLSCGPPAGSQARPQGLATPQRHASHERPSAGEPYEITEDEDSITAGEEAAQAGFQVIDFQTSGQRTERRLDGPAHAAAPLRMLDDLGGADTTAGLPQVERVKVQSSAHPAAESAAPKADARPEPPRGDGAGKGPRAIEEGSGGGGVPSSDSIAEEQNPADAAREAVAAGDWKLARRWVDAWLLDDPTSHDAADALIQVCESMQDRRGVIEGLTLKGDLLIQGQELPAAVPLFWRVLEMDPHNETAQRRIGRFRELGLVAADAAPGHEDAAGEEAEGVVGGRDRQQEGARGRSAAPHGEAPAATRPEEPIVPEKALAVLAALREGRKQPVDPSAAGTHYERALVHMETGRLAEALAELEAALKQGDLDSEQSVRLWELRGKCLSGLGRHRDAIAELEPVLAKLEPADRSAATLQYFLALEHETLGDFDAAKQRLREIVEKTPDFQQATRRLAQLEERAA